MLSLRRANTVHGTRQLNYNSPQTKRYFTVLVAWDFFFHKPRGPGLEYYVSHNAPRGWNLSMLTNRSIQILSFSLSDIVFMYIWCHKRSGRNRGEITCIPFQKLLQNWKCCKSVDSVCILLIVFKYFSSYWKKCFPDI